MLKLLASTWIWESCSTRANHQNSTFVVLRGLSLLSFFAVIIAGPKSYLTTIWQTILLMNPTVKKKMLWKWRRRSTLCSTSFPFTVLHPSTIQCCSVWITATTDILNKINKINSWFLFVCLFVTFGRSCWVWIKEGWSLLWCYLFMQYNFLLTFFGWGGFNHPIL